jgi:hypothetical protein
VSGSLKEGQEWGNRYALFMTCPICRVPSTIQIKGADSVIARMVSVFHQQAEEERKLRSRYRTLLNGARREFSSDTRNWTLVLSEISLLTTLANDSSQKTPRTLRTMEARCKSTLKTLMHFTRAVRYSTARLQCVGGIPCLGRQGPEQHKFSVQSKSRGNRQWTRRLSAMQLIVALSSPRGLCMGER